MVHAKFPDVTVALHALCMECVASHLSQTSQWK